jgi:hypothetical protein
MKAYCDTSDRSPGDRGRVCCVADKGDTLTLEVDMADVIIRNFKQSGRLMFERCSACKEPITQGEPVTFDGKTYHEQCYEAIKRTV